MRTTIDVEIMVKGTVHVMNHNTDYASTEMPNRISKRYFRTLYFAVIGSQIKATNCLKK